MFDAPDNQQPRLATLQLWGGVVVDDLPFLIEIDGQVDEQAALDYVARHLRDYLTMRCRRLVLSLEPAIEPDLVSRIRARLAVLGVSPYSVAREHGLHRTLISDLLTGRTKRIHGRNLPRIAAALDCDEAFLTGAQSLPRMSEPAVVPGRYWVTGTVEAVLSRDAVQRVEVCRLPLLDVRARAA